MNQMSIEQARQLTNEAMRQAIFHNKPEDLKAILENPFEIECDDDERAPMGFWSINFEVEQLLYEVFSENPSFDALRLTYSYFLPTSREWAYVFSMKEFYKFITNHEFNNPPIIELFSKHGYNMDEQFMNFAFHNEVIPSRVQEALYKYKACFSENIAHKSIKAFYKEELIDDEPYPEAYVQWMLFYYEDFALGLNRKKFIKALDGLYESNQELAFGLLLSLKFQPEKKDFKHMSDNLKKAYLSIQLNETLNNKITPNKKEARAKI